MTPAGYDLAAGGGEMGARVLRHDWAATPLGDLASWPQALRLTVGLLLESRHPMMLAWGPELRMLYNDACGETLGDRHPSALGAPASDAWGAAWTQLGPRLRLVLERAQAVHEQRIRLLVERGGVPEETFLTVSCTPVRHGHGVGGVLCHIVDETAQVVGERRLRALHGLAAGLASARTREALEKEAGPLLGRAPHDVPFALLYLRGSGGALRLASHAGLETAPTAPATLPDAAAWPCPEAGIGVVELGGLGLPSAGAGDLPPRQAAVVPVPAQAQEPAAGFLVLGLSPHRRFDEGYRAFLEALAAQVASGLASARSHQEERRQAEEKLQAALVASGSGT
ncbi:MAG TPA: hypothetical protein VFH47_06825, partial [Candidatus Thermoplasmatota archaeon]|nr:hypothetical protein [Candidatus Thermoplasmatota archaeon]